MEKIETRTPDLTEENIEKLIDLFPQVATEVENEEGEVEKAIDFDALRDLLGDVAEGQRERYQFTWPGKREAKAEARRPIDKTMIPCPEKSVDWDTTKNLYIEGDNLDALKLLKETYAGKVKLIYLDPPYNTGNDFIYRDNFTISENEYENADLSEEGQLVANPESSGRFHSNWCSMIYPRLLLSRDLLQEDGIILFSIGDDELSNAIKIFDEVFGHSNQICIFTWKSRAKPTNAGNAKYRPQKVGEYVLAYGKKSVEEHKFNVFSNTERTYSHADEHGQYRTTTILTSNRGTFQRETMRFESHGFKPDKDSRWKAGKEKIDELFETGHIAFNENGIPVEKKYAHEEEDATYPIYCFIDPSLSGTAEQGKGELNALLGNRHGFDTVKPINLIKYFVQTFSSDQDLVLDFFSGSGTTANAVMELNAEQAAERTYISVQIAEEIGNEFSSLCEIGEERIKRAGEKLSEKIRTENEQLKLGEDPKQIPDIGFRVLRIDSSNFKDTYLTPDQTDQASLLDAIDNVKEGRTPEDILFQVLPAFRIPYSAHIEELDINGKKVFDVNYGQLLACFDADVANGVIEEIARRKPSYAVMRDLSFKDDSAAANFEELFKTFSPDTIRRVI